MRCLIEGIVIHKLARTRSSSLSPIYIRARLIVGPGMEGNASTKAGSTCRR